MIKPTVGRIVWYRPGSGQDRDDMAIMDGQPLAAIVTAAWSDTCINLAVLDVNGKAHSRTSVLLHQDGNPRPDQCFAEWMPFQKGQAAKTEALEGKLAVAG